MFLGGQPRLYTNGEGPSVCAKFWDLYICMQTYEKRQPNFAW